MTFLINLRLTVKLDRNSKGISATSQDYEIIELFFITNTNFGKMDLLNNICKLANTPVNIENK